MLVSFRILLLTGCFPVLAQGLRIPVQDFSIDPVLRFELSVGPCLAAKKTEANGRCPIEVRLREQDRILGTETLEWPGVAGTSGKIEVTPSNDFPGRDRHLSAIWVLGPAAEDGYFDSAPLAVSAQTFSFPGGPVVLLVTEEGGFEHTHRHHAVFAAVGKKIKKVWEGGDNAGPRVTRFSVVNPEKAPPSLLFFDVFYGEGQAADTLEVSRLQWNEKRSRLEPSRKKIPALYANILGSYRTFPEANKAREAMGFRCTPVNAYLLVPSESLPRLEKKGFVIASLRSDQATAERDLAEAKSCTPPREGSVKRVF